MLGNFADKVPAGKTRNALNNFWKPWFYEHVRSILKQDKEQEEYITFTPFLSPSYTFFFLGNGANCSVWQ
ncbi:hypothetical protein BMR02_02760 [Methylococcaceae bacterium HT1]|nr:hypothetical protein BMR02_02760 [Methylococcaceae bacterium HT1]